MASTMVQDLSPEFKSQFNIDQVISTMRGGQKTVFIVTRNDDTKYALKLFHNFGKRDVRELEIYKKFEHINGIPKIISIENFGEDKVVFEEYIEGASLNSIVKSYAGNFEKIRDLVIKICTILAPIWNDKKIHRDIKLNNIMIRSNGDPVVIDFGIAQDLVGTAYTTNFIPNSWDFASPEQLLNQRELIDYRSDFFSIGIVAYVLYYQRKPFGNSLDEVLEKFNKKDNQYKTDIGCKLNHFLKECLGFFPTDRPRNLLALLETLK